MTDSNPAEKAADAAKDKMGDLEKKLDKHSNKLPKLSSGNREMVANFLPWGIGIYGLLSLFWAKDMWDGLRALDAVDSLFGELGSLASSLTPSTSSMWVSVVLLVITGVLIGFGFMKGLLSKSKEGWNFSFYAMVVSVVSGLWFVFMLDKLQTNRGWLILIIGLVGLYGLFQTKAAFKKD